MINAFSSVSRFAIGYVDGANRTSEPTIWPFLVGYAEGLQVLMAWCELREDFRIFRTDRLVSIDYTTERYAERRSILRSRWLKLMSDRRERDHGSSNRCD